MDISLEIPLNTTSLGNVAFNVVKDLCHRDINFGIWPIGPVDLSPFNVSDYEKFKIERAINERFSFLDKEIPSLKIWHLNGSEKRINPKQYLYTFYECNQPTEVEKAIAKVQDECFFCSSYAANSFQATYVPLGLDPEFKVVKDLPKLNDVIHFGLMGKFEKRKHTKEIIQLWTSKYGNNNKYQLTCLVTNPFFKPEQMEACIADALGGKRFSNVNFLPFLQKNEEVNLFLNAIDIDLTGLSGAEGWNLPSFNATCLGKWSIVLNATSHKDWANEKNSILVEPSHKEALIDGFFFTEKSNFNKGEFYVWDKNEVVAAMETAEKKCKELNKEGMKLIDSFSYQNTVDIILNRMQEE